MIHRMSKWPPAETVAHAGEDLFVLVRAGRELVRNEAILDAARLLLCRHSMSALLRPLVVMVFELVDTSVKRYA